MTLSVARRLVGVCGSVVEIAVLAMFHTGQYLTLRGTIALQRIRDDDAWDISQALEQLAEEPLGRFFVTPALHQNIEHMAILIDRPPHIVPFAIDAEKDFIEVPLVTRSGAAMS